MELNNFYNEDCSVTMSKMKDHFVDLVLTSPPYNMTKRKGGYADKQNRYDEYLDWKSDQEYIKWTIDIFNEFDRVLKENKIVLYNFSYSIENPVLPYQIVSEINSKTNFTIADTIIWKKSNAIPHPASYNRLNRIIEFIFVFVRKNEIKTFDCHKQVSKTSPKGQKYYEIVENFITAKNNDGSNNLNKATYSTELCEKLLSIYASENYIVYDPFMGTGTTAAACKNMNMFFIGSEISEKQVEYSKKRIDLINNNTDI